MDIYTHIQHLKIYIRVNRVNNVCKPYNVFKGLTFGGQIALCFNIISFSIYTLFPAVFEVLLPL